MGRLLLAAMHPLKMIFSVRIVEANNFTPTTRALPVPNKMEVMLSKMKESDVALQTSWGLSPPDADTMR